jgi:predicted membrane protein
MKTVQIHLQQHGYMIICVLTLLFGLTRFVVYVDTWQEIFMFAGLLLLPLSADSDGKSQRAPAVSFRLWWESVCSEPNNLDGITFKKLAIMTWNAAHSSHHRVGWKSWHITGKLVARVLPQLFFTIIFAASISSNIYGFAFAVFVTWAYSYSAHQWLYKRAERNRKPGGNDKPKRWNEIMFAVCVLSVAALWGVSVFAGLCDGFTCFLAGE